MGMSQNIRLGFGIVSLSYSIAEIKLLPVLTAILNFKALVAVGRCKREAYLIGNGEKP
jgi:hypothetical protein